MTIQTWPSGLPAPEKETWSAQYMDPRRKRQNSAGPPSYRKMFSSVPKLVTMSLLLTRDQKSVFDRFYTLTTDFGTDLFWMPDPTVDGWQLVDTGGNPLAASGSPIQGAGRWLCSFGDTPPSETISNHEWRITMQIVVMP